MPVLWEIDEADSGVYFSLGATDASRYYAVRSNGPSGNMLVARNRADGTVFWRASVSGLCDLPLVTSGAVYCPASSLTAHSPATGDLLWQRTLSAGLGVVRGTADEERVYVGTITYQNSEAVALRAVDGQVLWQRTFDGPGWIGNQMRSFALSPEGDLLIALEAEFGPPGSVFSASAVVAVNPATGEERWRFVDGGPTTDLGIGGLAIWENLVIYMAAQELVAFDRSNRQVVWRVPWTPGFISNLAPPSVVDGVVYFADGGGTSFAVDARTGRRIWETWTRGGAYGQIVCGPYFLKDNGPVDIIERATGRSQGRLLDSDDSAGYMAVADNTLYVGSERGVYAFDCNG